MKAEQFINDYTKGCSNELCSVEDRYGKTIISYREWLTPDQALRAAEIAKEETIEKACEYIRDYAPIYYNCDGFIEHFRKAMQNG